MSDRASPWSITRGVPIHGSAEPYRRVVVQLLCARQPSDWLRRIAPIYLRCSIRERPQHVRSWWLMNLLSSAAQAPLLAADDLGRLGRSTAKPGSMRHRQHSTAVDIQTKYAIHAYCSRQAAMNPNFGRP